jgi:hypothetical protein
MHVIGATAENAWVYTPPITGVSACSALDLDEALDAASASTLTKTPVTAATDLSMDMKKDPFE